MIGENYSRLFDVDNQFRQYKAVHIHRMAIEGGKNERRQLPATRRALSNVGCTSRTLRRRCCRKRRVMERGVAFQVLREGSAPASRRASALGATQ